MTDENVNTETNGDGGVILAEAYEKADIFVDKDGLYKMVILDSFVVSGIQCYEIKILDSFASEKVSADMLEIYLKENDLSLLVTSIHKLKRLAKNVTLGQGEIYHKDGVGYIEILTGRLIYFDNKSLSTNTVFGVREIGESEREYLANESSLKEHLFLVSDELRGLRETYLSEVDRNGR